MSERVLKRATNTASSGRKHASTNASTNQSDAIGNVQAEDPTPESIIHLQRTIGNAAVQRLINEKTARRIQRFSLGDVWDTVADLGSKAWDALTGGDSDKKQPSDAIALNVPSGKWTVTDKQAVVRLPPPDLTEDMGKPLIPKGVQITVLEAARKGSKYHVHVQEHGNTEGEPRDFGWTAAVNIKGLPAALASANPGQKDVDEDKDVPKPGKGGIPGLPELPDLAGHTEFNAIVQQMEMMEQNPLAIEEEHREETGDERTERIEKIASVRKEIAALASKLPGVEATKLKEAQAYLYRRLAPLTPYFGQMANTNMLYKDGKGEGWGRSCNVTVPAMVIEGLGKTKSDYDEAKAGMPLALLQQVFAALEGKYKTRKEYEAVTEFDALRLPDFMTLVGIAHRLPKNAGSLDDKAFVKAVEKARQVAATTTKAHETMIYLIEQFGAETKQGYIQHDILDEIGTARKKYTKQKLHRETPSPENKASYESVEADKLLPVSSYRAEVLKKINPLLDRGSQVLVGMEEHFVRLDALGEDAIQVDDPGDRVFKNLRVNWEQARDLGYFKIYWEITG